MLTQRRKRLLNLAALALLGAGAAFLVFRQVRERDQAVEKKAAEERLFSIPDLGAIDEVILQTPAGELRVARDADEPRAWRVVAPLATPAEQSTVDALVRQVGTLKRQRLVGEKQSNGSVTPPAELWMFGLEPPRLTVTLVERTGATHQLLVGKRNSFDGAIYVKRGDRAEIALVDGGFDYQVNKDLYQLRDKRLVTFAEEAVQRLQVTHGSESYALVRDGEQFRLNAPVSAPADAAQVSGLLSALVNVRAKAFVSEAVDAAQLGPHGLRPPAATLQVELGDGQRLTAWFGQVKIGATVSYFATLGEGRPLLELSSDWLIKKLLVDVTALRDRRVLLVERERVAGLRVRRGDRQLELRKSRDEEKERDVWQVTAPTPGAADAATVTGLLYRLATLKAERIVVEQASAAQLTDHHLDQPEVAVELLDEAGTVLAGAGFAKSASGEWVALAQGQSRIDLVEPGIVEDLSVEAADYQAPALDEE